MCRPRTIATFEFDFKPEVRLITSTRTYLGDLCGHVLLDAATSSRVALTAHEMLENVAKYSRDGKNSLEVELCRRDGRGFVQIRTKNRAAERAARAASAVLGNAEGTRCDHVLRPCDRS
jgi:two-component sensor histidine kinase